MQQSAETVDQFNQLLTKEIDFFHSVKLLDFSQLFSDYVDEQIDHNEKSVKIWQDAVDALS